MKEKEESLQGAEDVSGRRNNGKGKILQEEREQSG